MKTQSDSNAEDQATYLINMSCIYLVNHTIQTDIEIIKEIVSLKNENHKKVFNKIIALKIIHCINKVDPNKLKEILSLLKEKKFSKLLNIIDMSDFDIENFKSLNNFELNKIETKVWKLIRKTQAINNGRKPNDSDNDEKYIKQSNPSESNEKSDINNEKDTKIETEENVTFIEFYYKLFYNIGYEKTILLLGLFFIVIYIIYDLLFGLNLIEIKEN